MSDKLEAAARAVLKWHDDLGGTRTDDRIEALRAALDEPGAVGSGLLEYQRRRRAVSRGEYPNDPSTGALDEPEQESGADGLLVGEGSDDPLAGERPALSQASEPAPEPKLHYSGPASRAFWKAVDGLEGGAWNEAYASGVELQNMEERVLKMLPPAPETAIERRPVEEIARGVVDAWDAAASPPVQEPRTNKEGRQARERLIVAVADALRAERGTDDE